MKLILLLSYSNFSGPNELKDSFELSLIDGNALIALYTNLVLETRQGLN